MSLSFRRALVIGCPGAGKSTFARKLAGRTGLPLVHLDQLFWGPGWVMVPHETYLERLSSSLAQDRWVIDGTNASTLDLRLPRAEAVFWLDRHRMVCLARVLCRILTSYGHVRPDAAEGCPERLDRKFLEYVWTFHAKYGPRIGAALERNGARERTVMLTRDCDIEFFLETLRQR